MSAQFKINSAVNYWKSEKTWERILSELGFSYRTEPTDDGIKIIVHDRKDPENVYGIAEEYTTGEQSEITELSDHMLRLLNLGDVESLDRQQFVCFYIFFANYNEMLKKEIMPFYEMHLRDLAAEEMEERLRDVADVATE